MEQFMILFHDTLFDLLVFVVPDDSYVFSMSQPAFCGIDGRKLAFDVQADFESFNVRLSIVSPLGRLGNMLTEVIQCLVYLNYFALHSHACPK